MSSTAQDALLALKPDSWESLYEHAMKLPKGLDLTDDSMDPVLEKMADDIVALFPSLESLEKVDLELCSDAPKLGNVALLTAMKMARSKLCVKAFAKPVHITYVVPVYKESNRIKNRKDCESGEDFVRRKERQMRWQCAGVDDKLTFDMLYVDDGCPVNSGGLVQAIIDDEKIPNTEVVFLQKAIDDKIGPFHEHLKSAKTDSRKGGAVMYGFYHALKRDNAPAEIAAASRHVYAFTDSDLSTNLGQTGLLLQPIVSSEDGSTVLSAGARYVNGGVYCSAYSPSVTYNLEERSERQEEGSTWVHLCNMWSRIYFRDRLLPPFTKLSKCVDTQCGFKAVDSSIISDMVTNVTDYWSTVDIEILLFSAMRGGGSFVPVVWVESMAESNFWSESGGGDLAVYKGYFEMNGTMLGIQRKYKLDANDEWNALVDKMTLEQYGKMIRSIEADMKQQKALLLEYAPDAKELAARAGVEL